MNENIAHWVEGLIACYSVFAVDVDDILNTVYQEQSMQSSFDSAWTTLILDFIAQQIHQLHSSAANHTPKKSVHTTTTPTSARTSRYNHEEHADTVDTNHVSMKVGVLQRKGNWMMDNKQR